MPAIFISHSSLDQKAADDIKTVLAGLGFDRVFLDFDKVTGVGVSENWEKRLHDEIARCHAIILIVTPNWLASKWCFAELQQARALGKVILPVVFGPPDESYVLPEIQSVDLIDWKREGMTLLERRLNAITHELARGFRLEPNRPPYPGIHAFEAEDAAIYFGRDDETRAIIEKLDARRTQGGVRFLLVIGASGAGKSSLLKAGVLPQLERRRSHWLLLPVMRPEKAPLEAFTKTLAQHLGRENDWRALYDDLRDPNAASRIAQIIQDLRVGEHRAATVLLPIDQFEELFTVAEPDERASLLTLLAAILDPALGLPLMVIATGRADVLQGLLETSALALLMDTTPLLPMPLDRVPQLVKGPAAVASLVVEPGLAERIMRDVENPEALPLLAYMLHLLHERSPDRRLTHDAYHALGDGNLNPVQNAVRLGADEAIAGLKPTEQEMAALRDAFIPHLVRLRLDDKRHVRQPAPLAALPREAERLIHALIEARLLTSRTSDQGVPVVHEALFSAWPTLKSWLDDEQDFLADIERLKGAHETWMQAAEAQKPQGLLQGLLLSRTRGWLAGYPQRFADAAMEPLRAFIANSAKAEDAESARRQQRRRRTFQGMTAAILVLAVATAFAIVQRGEAVIQRGIAETQTELAQRREQEADRQRVLAESQTKLALQSDQDSKRQRETAERNFNIAKKAADDVGIKLALNLRDIQGMRAEWVRQIIDIARSQMDQLGQAAPDDLELQRSYSATLNEFANTFLDAGDFARAREASVESLSIMRRVAALDPERADWQHALALSLYRNSDVHLSMDSIENAGVVSEESLSIMRRLTISDQSNFLWQRDLSASLEKSGNVKWRAGDKPGAFTAYEESLTIDRKLAKADPSNTKWQRDLRISLEKIGDVKQDAGDNPGALAAHEEGLAISRTLVKADPTNTLLQRYLRASLEKIGEVKHNTADVPGALAVYSEAATINRKLVDADPGNAGLQYDMGASLSRFGDILLAAGDRDGAFAAFKEGLTSMRKLTATDPGNGGWQIGFFIGLYDVGKMSDPATAREFMTEALDIADGLAQKNKLPANQEGWPETIRDALAKLPSDEAKPRQ